MDISNNYNDINVLNNKSSNLNFLNSIFISFIIMTFILVSDSVYAGINMKNPEYSQHSGITENYINTITLVATMGQISNNNAISKNIETDNGDNSKTMKNTTNSPLIDPNKYQKPSEQEIKQKLSAEEYAITQQSGTERAHSGQYVNTKTKGIYVDIVTGEPLFMSTHKYDSGTGWPSFTQPIQKDILAEHKDTKYGMVRTEVRSRVGDSHLGHVFDDGPKDKGGLRYCINSASLRFVAYDDMEKEGYGYLMQIVE